MTEQGAHPLLNVHDLAITRARALCTRSGFGRFAPGVVQHTTLFLEKPLA